jgi:prepilin-type processing-associated H-X9-DG protein
MLKWVLSLTVALVVAGSAKAQPLADRVPGDALIYIGWSGSDSMGPGYAGSHLEAVLKDSKLSELVNEALPRLFKQIAAKEPGAAEPLAMFQSYAGAMWRHPSAFYFGGFSPGNPNGPPMPKFAMLCDAGAEGKALADKIRGALAQAHPPFEIKVEEQGGMVVMSVGAQGWGAAQRPAAALAASATFKAALAQVQKDAVASVYLDMEGIVKLADQMTAGSPAGQSWANTRDSLGLGAIKRLIATAGFDQKDWITRAFIESPSPRKGAAAGLFATPLSNDILKAVPQSATVMSAGKFDLGGLVSGIRSFAAAMDPQAGQQVDAVLAQIRDSIGLDLQTDVFDLFGDEWAAYLDPMGAGQGIFGYTIVNRAKNPTKLEASLTRLEDVINSLVKSAMGPDAPTIAIERTPITGTTLHHLAVPLVSPCWAIKDGNLYLGLYPQVVEAAVEQGSGRNKSILDNEDYIAVRKRLGGEAASGIGFANLPKTAPEGYQQVLMISRLYLGGADLFGAQTPAMAIPPLRKIMPHLTPSGDVAWTDASGWHYKGVSPFPGSDLLTPGGGGGQVILAEEALLVSILLPSLNRARETANRVKCGSNMRQIGQGILLYANENKGKYPPNLGILVKTEELTPEVFVCPSGNTAPPNGLAIDDQVKWVNDNADYVYLGAGMNITAGAEVIVLYEKPGAHGNQGMNILYGDGHVEFQMMQSAMQQIQRQTANKKGGGQ